MGNNWSQQDASRSQPQRRDHATRERLRCGEQATLNSRGVCEATVMRTPSEFSNYRRTPPKVTVSSMHARQQAIAEFHAHTTH